MAKKTIDENAAQISDAKTALLRLRDEALSNIKSTDLLLKKATKNHKKEISTINKQIADIDRKIKKCDRGVLPKMSIPIVRRKRGRPKGSKNRVKNTEPLHTVVLKVLKKRGLSLTKIVLAVVKSGYKSNSKDDFSKTVYQCLYKLQQSDKVKKDKNKIYRIVK
jgi:hypothetical protein